jgi:hypothetical protein
MIDLQKFCARADDPRDYLMKPWAHMGYLYATNGAVLVRVPAPEDQRTVIAAHSTGPAAAKLINEAPKIGHAPLPRYETGARCPVCGGTGAYQQVKCSECDDSSGYFKRGPHEYECKECEGTGWLEAEDGSEIGEMRDCDSCDGYGRQSKRVVIAPGFGYDGRLLDKIKDLPGLRFTNGADPEKAGHFQFDGGEGLLMPMRP